MDHREQRLRRCGTCSFYQQGVCRFGAQRGMATSENDWCKDYALRLEATEVWSVWNAARVDWSQS